MHNQHRGDDAAGYFRVPTGRSELVVVKSPGPADEILKNTKEEAISVSKVLGTHTRAYTQGLPTRNENNHPIVYNGIAVTHNGTIQNDHTIKKLAPEAITHLPVVDSVAINIVLSHVENPWDLNDIIAELELLKGSYAFHAVWEDNPGLSLLVRGESSPLVVYWHPKGMLAYGSEEQSIWQMLNAGEFDVEKDEDWVKVDMAEATAMLILDGVPIAHRAFHTRRGEISDEWMAVRKNPAVVANDGVSLVVTTRNESNFLFTPQTSSIDYEPDNDILVKEFSREEGFTNEKLEFPLVSPDVIWAKISEADRVYSDKESGLRFIWVGTTEIVIDALSQKLLDIYDHSLTSDKRDRFELVDISARELAVFEERNEATKFVDWLIPNSDVIKNPVTESQLPEYLRHTSYEALEWAYYSENYRGRQQNLLSPRLRWEDLPHLFVNEHDDTLRFMNDDKCYLHGKSYVAHEDPHDCVEVLQEAATTLERLENVDMWQYVTNSEIDIIEVEKKPFVNCTKHNWSSLILRTYRVGHVSYTMSVTELCEECNVRRKVVDMPDWLLNAHAKQYA